MFPPPSLLPTTQPDAPLLVPPITYALVAPGIWRSGHPNAKSFPFLETLKLKSIMYLDSESLRPDVLSFASSSSPSPSSFSSPASSPPTSSRVKVFHFPIGDRDVWDPVVGGRNVAPCAEAQGDGDEGSGEVESSGIEAEKMVDKAGGLVGDALRAILDERNHPILVFDNMGKAATTLVTSLLRTFQHWSLTSIFAEGDRFAGHGSEGGGIGLSSREYIALFDPKKLKYDESHKPSWLK